MSSEVNNKLDRPTRFPTHTREAQANDSDLGDWQIMETTHSYSRKDNLENLFSVSVLLVMALLPVLEIVGRELLGRGIVPGSIPLVEHLTLWIAFLGAMLATRSDRMLALSTVSFLPETARNPVRIFTGAVGAGVAAWLAWASFDLVRFEYEAPTEVAMGIRVWMAMCIMPAALALIAFRLIWHSSGNGWGRLLAGLGLALPIGLGLAPSIRDVGLVLPIAFTIVLATLLGMPILPQSGGWHSCSSGMMPCRWQRSRLRSTD